MKSALRILGVVLAVVVGGVMAGAFLVSPLAAETPWVQPAVLALASIAVIFVWYAVFRNHTAIHAKWMVRLLAWPIGMGCACLVLALASGRGSSKAAIQRPGHDVG